MPGIATAEETLKIGVLGVMSGPAASWGLTNKYCAEATANMYNAKGGIDIGAVGNADHDVRAADLSVIVKNLANDLAVGNYHP